MVIRREIVEERLRYLDLVLEELSKYRDVGPDKLRDSLSLRWAVERGLIAAATLVFDVLDHILAARFGVYPETYEDILRLSFEKGIISPELFQNIRGLGGFRNILVHQYLQVDMSELHRGLQKAFMVFPRFSREILDWLGSAV